MSTPLCIDTIIDDSVGTQHALQYAPLGVIITCMKISIYEITAVNASGIVRAGVSFVSTNSTDGLSSWGNILSLYAYANPTAANEVFIINNSIVMDLSANPFVVRPDQYFGIVSDLYSNCARIEYSVAAFGQHIYN